MKPVYVRPSFRNRTLIALGLSVVSNLSAAEPADTLEEVVVTARQREEKPIDVPVTEKAFGLQEIHAAGIERPEDFMSLTPGVSFVHAAEAGDLQVSIRGMNTARDAEPNFAFVVDGVLQTNPFGLSQELTNLQQIEVVKGPQGAVYGRNAVAGAIIINTLKPTNVLQADATLGYGNHNSLKGNFWVAGPVAARVDAGVAAFYTQTDGFHENRFLGCGDCVDFYDEYGVAPRIIFQVSDDATVDVKAKWSRVQSGAINFNADFELPAFAALNPDFYQNVNDHKFTYINNITPQNVQLNKQFSAKSDWKLPLGTLTAWAAYNDQTNYFLTDASSASFGLYAATPWCQQDIVNQVGAPLPSPTFYAGASSILPPFSPTRCDGYEYQQRDQIDRSIELRFTSPSDQRLRWLGGAYVAGIDRHVVVSQGADEGRGLLPQALVPTSGPNPTDLLFDDRFKSTVKAAFGQVAYDIVPHLEASAALRFDHEARTVDNRVPKVSPQTPGFGGFGVPDCPSGPTNCTVFINPFYNLSQNAGVSQIPARSAAFQQWEPKITLNWKVRDTWSTYASWGIGFRSGGFNSSGSAATVENAFSNLYYVTPSGAVTTTPALPVAGVRYNNAGQIDPTGNITYANGVSDEYKKEVSRASEIGTKAELLDRSLAVSAAYYYTKVDDMQFFNFLAGPFGLLRVVTNIDRVTLEGFEGELRWRASRYVSVFVGGSTINSTIDRYSGRPYTAGNRVPYAPSYTLNDGIDFTVPFGTGLTLLARVDSNTLGTTWYHPVQNNQVQTLFQVPGDYSGSYRRPFTLVNARLGLASELWELTAWGHNLGDKHYLTDVAVAPEFGGSFIHEGVGRSFGLEVSWHLNGR